MTQAGFDAGFEAYAAGDMRRLTRLAAMLTSDAESAKDLVQETLIRVGSAWSRIDRDGSCAPPVLSELRMAPSPSD